MSACPLSETCCFYSAVQPRFAKRIKFAFAFPYCNGGKYESCALHPFLAQGLTPPSDLLPTGDVGQYLADDADGSASQAAEQKVLVLDDSPIFAMLATNAVTRAIPGADVVCYDTYADAREDLERGRCGLIVCGYGVGDGLTAHDVRKVSSAPMVIFSGRPEGEIRVPANARLVTKSAGPDALNAAIGAALAG